MELLIARAHANITFVFSQQVLIKSNYAMTCECLIMENRQLHMLNEEYRAKVYEEPPVGWNELTVELGRF